MIAVANKVRRFDAVSRHDRRVPIGRPAFVHDLCLRLRGKIVGFVTNDREHVQLPGHQRRVLQHKKHDIFNRFTREALALRQ